MRENVARNECTSDLLRLSCEDDAKNNRELCPLGPSEHVNAKLGRFTH